jgi:hypothetical protein
MKKRRHCDECDDPDCSCDCHDPGVETGVTRIVPMKSANVVVTSQIVEGAGAEYLGERGGVV